MPMKIVKMPVRNNDPFKRPKEITRVIANEISREVSQKASTVRKEVTDKTMTAIASAFAFVIALTWNETIKSIVNGLVNKFSLPQVTYIREIIVAVIITTICVIGILLVSKYGSKKE